MIAYLKNVSVSKERTNIEQEISNDEVFFRVFFS